MRFTDDFEEREWLCRQALKEMKLVYPEYFKWDINFTTEKYAAYDAYWFIINENQQIKKRVWVEMKTRDTEYPDWVLEKKKLDGMIRERKALYLEKDDVDFLYIVFSPSKTLIWNITNVKDEKKSKREVMNKATSNSRDEKEAKEVYYLEPEEGKVLDYVLRKKVLLHKSYDEYLLDKVKDTFKRKPGLEDILFN